MTTRHRAGFNSLCALVLVMAVPAGAAAGQPEPAALQVRSDGSRHRLQFGDGPAFRETVSQIRGAHLIEVPAAPTRLILWQEALPDGRYASFYAISLDGQGVACVRRTSYALKLRYGEFDPLESVPPVEAGFEADASMSLFLVQFVTQPLEVFRRQIEELGGTVHQFVANHAHIVRMSPGVREAVAALPYVRWVGPLHPAYRLAGFLLDNRAAAEDLFPRQRYNIMVFQADQRPIVARRITARGGTVDKANAGKYLLQTTLTPEQLFVVVRWDEVLFVDRWGSYELDMNIAREIGGANYVEFPGGYTGAGVRGEVFDNGFNLEHVDFQSRPLIVHGSAPSASHGASTSGIIFGDGTGNPIARGILPDGQGIVAGYQNLLGYPQARYDHTAELLEAPYFAVFQTSSVGSPRTIHYTTISADMDAMLFDLDIVHIQTQGNGTLQDSRPEAWAKNIISVGGNYHYDTLTKDDDCWCGGASIGPASDGRIKPDFTHFYDQIFTVTSGGPIAYTPSFGGSSGATPIVAGHVGLFSQMWADGIFGNPVNPQGTVFENRCHMATAKAMMINTASQYPFVGLDHDFTRVHQGWGLPDVRWMYDMREKTFVIDETALLSPFEQATFRLIVPPYEPEFRATLVYADPPGVPLSSQHRINDLTLRVTSPAGLAYWGNHGLLSQMYSDPDGEPNTVDTVENVMIHSPQPGIWVVEVFADEINQDGHVETPVLDVDFALVVSGVIPHRLGDLNCDGAINAFDIDPFVLALTDPDGYAAAWPDCDIMLADCNGDGVVDAFDIDPFVALLVP